ncbi:hypothetical protein BN7_5983 [Wickerhamomyces ciferrii]|uniref:Uncharacterized protein n=1 Tax=Wickerhamomyces ciferrii (strain ATCC 14091 / BCRC 22168 / CBS 111 / JCM 3599 / NBRC 0793 / NRRL Y-1031 F-60-10) TaxID=1206466 RepID=K0KMA5_WICCF|nr:uncharacterized protein BN7_5983 [Wickerhamomyces ciferrii]CCH46390.1 hypothetical protein BN7_5983 [Wickerhamomyces ciferrii]
MNLTYMIHPNNHLTKLDNFTISNMESYSSKLDQEIKLLQNATTKTTTKQTDQIKGSLSKIINYKKIEKNYILSYLKILKLLETIDTKCCTNDSNYDYEAEDEILDSIEVHMFEFKEFEKQLESLNGGIKIGMKGIDSTSTTSATTASTGTTSGTIKTVGTTTGESLVKE